MRESVNEQPLRTLANSDRKVRPEVEDIRTETAKMRIDAKNRQDDAGFGPGRGIVREAMRRSGLTNKAFAIDAKQPESVISEGLSGSRGLQIEWVWAQTHQPFHMHLSDLWREAKRLDQDAIERIEDRELADLLARVMRKRRTA